MIGMRIDACMSRRGVGCRRNCGAGRHPRPQLGVSPNWIPRGATFARRHSNWARLLNFPQWKTATRKKIGRWKTIRTKPLLRIIKKYGRVEINRITGTRCQTHTVAWAPGSNVSAPRIMYRVPRDTSLELRSNTIYIRWIYRKIRLLRQYLRGRVLWNNDFLSSSYKPLRKGLILYSQEIYNWLNLIIVCNCQFALYSFVLPTK